MHRDHNAAIVIRDTTGGSAYVVCERSVVEHTLNQEPQFSTETLLKVVDF